jgi:hypothetical protein
VKGILTMTAPKNLTPGQRAQVGFRRGRTITAVDARFSKVGVYSVFVPGHGRRVADREFRIWNDDEELIVYPRDAPF